MARLFVTGGSGFLGTRLLPLIQERGSEVIALRRPHRRPRAAEPAAPPPCGTATGAASAGRVQWIAGDLLEPDSYAPALAGADAVLHLAAATGPEPERVHQRVNHRGTADLVARARAAGVPRFLLVSSIAAGFADTSRYPYARSKAAAEASVAGAGRRHLIVRPTLLLGPGSAALAGLDRLARLPVIPIFGTGRTPVQPLDVDDLARALCHLVLDQDRFRGETLELGGPERIAIEDLVQAIRRCRGGPAGRVVHLPAGPLTALLWGLERLGLRLPLTAGQIQTFLQDGTATGPPPAGPPDALTPLEESLRRSLAGAGS